MAWSVTCTRCCCRTTWAPRPCSTGIWHQPGATLNTPDAGRGRHWLQKCRRPATSTATPTPSTRTPPTASSPAERACSSSRAPGSRSTLPKSFDGQYGFVPFPAVTAGGTQVVSMTGNNLVGAIAAKSQEPGRGRACSSTSCPRQMRRPSPEKYGYAASAPGATATISMDGTITQQIQNAYTVIANNNGFTDWIEELQFPRSIPWLAAQLQLMLAGKVSPADMVKKLQDTYCRSAEPERPKLDRHQVADMTTPLVEGAAAVAGVRRRRLLTRPRSQDALTGRWLAGYSRCRPWPSTSSSISCRSSPRSRISFLNWDGIGVATWVGPRQLRPRLQRSGSARLAGPRLLPDHLLQHLPARLRAGGRLHRADDERPVQRRHGPHRSVPSADHPRRRRRRGLALDVLQRRRGQPATPAGRARGDRPGRGSATSTGRCTAVGFIGTWLETGFVTLLLLSGIGKINPALYEAAQLDGAGFVQEVRHITMPGLRREIGVAITVTIIAALASFDTVYMRPREARAPRRTCRASPSTTWRSTGSHLGSASALAIVLALLVIAVVSAVAAALQGELNMPDRRTLRTRMRPGYAHPRGGHSTRSCLCVSMFTAALAPQGTVPGRPLAARRSPVAQLRGRIQHREHDHAAVLEHDPGPGRRADLGAHLDDGRLRHRHAQDSAGQPLLHRAAADPHASVRDRHRAALYLEVKSLGLLDSRLGLILPLIGLNMPFAVFWMRAHFIGTPRGDRRVGECRRRRAISTRSSLSTCRWQHRTSRRSVS